MCKCRVPLSVEPRAARAAAEPCAKQVEQNFSDDQWTKNIYIFLASLKNTSHHKPDRVQFSKYTIYSKYVNATISIFQQLQNQ